MSATIGSPTAGTSSITTSASQPVSTNPSSSTLCSTPDHSRGARAARCRRPDLRPAFVAGDDRIGVEAHNGLGAVAAHLPHDPSTRRPWVVVLMSRRNITMLNSSHHNETVIEMSGTKSGCSASPIVRNTIKA